MKGLTLLTPYCLNNIQPSLNTCVADSSGGAHIVDRCII